MGEPSQPLTKCQAIDQVASQMTDPVDLEKFIHHVLVLWPSESKNPKDRLRQTLKFDLLERILLLLDKTL